jgi:hypothetical protein
MVAGTVTPFSVIAVPQKNFVSRAITDGVKANMVLVKNIAWVRNINFARGFGNIS